MLEEPQSLFFFSLKYARVLTRRIFRFDTCFVPVYLSFFLKWFPADRVRLRDFCLFGTYDRTWRHWSYAKCWLWMPDAIWHRGVLPSRRDSFALPRCHIIFCAIEIWIGCKRIGVGRRLIAMQYYAYSMSKCSANWLI